MRRAMVATAGTVVGLVALLELQVLRAAQAAKGAGKRQAKVRQFPAL